MHSRQILLGLLYHLAVSVPVINAEPKARVLHTFEDGTFVENLVVRSNGNVLFGTFGQGNVYEIDPTASSTEPRLIAKLPEADAITGIAEVSPNVFALTAGVRTGPVSVEDFKLFSLNLQHRKPAVKSVANMTGVTLLNGMTTLPGQKRTVYSADSLSGIIWGIDYTTGQKKAVVTDELLEPIEGANFPFGINGVRAHGSYLYFTNTARGLFGRVPVTKSGRQAGKVEIVAERPGGLAAPGGWDDFAVVNGKGCGPQAYLGSIPNAIDQIDIKTGIVSTFFGGKNDTTLDSPTSVAFSKDHKRMYVTSAGLGGPGGQVVEITL